MTLTRDYIDGYVGCMFAKKTLLMLHDVSAAEATGRTAIVFKPSIDDRYATDVVRSRGGGEHIATPIPVNNPEKIFEILTGRHRPDLVAIDEIQFFDPTISEVVKTLAQSGIKIVFSGLNRDYRGNAFPTMEKVMPLATNLTVVEAKCMFSHNGNSRMCGADAQMTQRLLNGHPDSYNSPTVIIEKPGTEISYQARCLEHWQVADMPKNRTVKFLTNS